SGVFRARAGPQQPLTARALRLEGGPAFARDDRFVATIRKPCRSDRRLASHFLRRGCATCIGLLVDDGIDAAQEEARNRSDSVDRLLLREPVLEPAHVRVYDGHVTL